MKISTTVSLLIPLFALAACPGGPPTEDPAETNARQIGVIVDLAHQGHTALDLLSRLPVFGCGEERSPFAARLVDQARAEWACAQVTLQAGAEADRVAVVFPEAGCDVEGRRLSGPLRLLLSGGGEGFSLEMDAKELQVDGAPLRVSGGYQMCTGPGAWAATSGSLPERPDSQYRVQLQVAMSQGQPLLAPDKLVLDGSGTVSGVGPTFNFSVLGLKFRKGMPLPEEGAVSIQPVAGRGFGETFPRKL